MAECGGNGRCAGIDFEFAKNVRDMCARGTWTYPQRGRDIAVRLSLRKQSQHFNFSFGQSKRVRNEFSSGFPLVLVP